MTDLASASLAHNVAGQAVVQKLLTEQELVRERGTLARLCGVSPLHEDNRPWYWGALGERAVGDVLDGLGEGWHVLHAVPVGKRDSDIDHVVVGPAGVLTLNTKNHSGKNIWVAGGTFMVSGQRKPWVRNSTHEAARAEKLLSAAVGFPVAVRAAIVVNDPAKLTVKEQPDGVTVLTTRRLARWLRKQPRRLDPQTVGVVAAAAADPATWQQTRTADPVDAPSLVAAFRALDGEVRSAMRVRLTWQLGLGAGVALASVRLLQSLS